MKYLSILLVIAFWGCKANQQVKENTATQNQDWSIESQKKYETLNEVDIKITNNTKNNLIIFDPFSKRIEKFDGENWQRISIPYCPCSSCPPPPETMPISANSKHFFKWNKNVITCKNGVKVSTKMNQGLYRVTFNYGKSENVRTFKKLVIEFEI